MSHEVAVGRERGPWWPDPCRRSFGFLGFLVLAEFAVFGPQVEGAVCGEHRPAGDFAEGVHIDWQQGVVEVGAVVVLRQGLLELVACSPNTREHESILRVAARPHDIYNALGLIGLVPGKPVRRDAGSDRWLPPTGSPLRIEVRYRDHDEEKTVPVERWLLESDKSQIPGPLPWVFAGSVRASDGTFGADEEGTIVCVVDFSTAMIAVGALHTSSDDELWLAANTELIPPVGTRCTLMIGQAGPKPIVVEMHAGGTLLADGKEISVARLGEMAGRKGSEQVTGGVVLLADPTVPKEAVDRTVKALVDHGLQRQTIRVLHPTDADGQ